RPSPSASPSTSWSPCRSCPISARKARRSTISTPTKTPSPCTIRSCTTSTIGTATNKPKKLRSSAMQTRVKTAREIEAMRQGGHMLATVLQELRRCLQPGMSTKDLAVIAAAELKALGGEPTILGYEGFPDVICISVNDEVVHGIPSPRRIIQEGYIV